METHTRKNVQRPEPLPPAAGSAAVIVAEGYHRLKAENERMRDALSVSIARWREKAAAFERRSSTVEGPMDDVLLSKAQTLRTCALDIEDTITPNVCVSDGPIDAHKSTSSAEGPFAARNG